MIGGADIKEMARLDQKSAEKFITGLRDLCEAVRIFPAPVIACLPGWCLGGGLEVAAACDFRIAAHDAKFAMPEVRVGIPSVIHAALLPRLIGWGRTRWLVMRRRLSTLRLRLPGVWSTWSRRKAASMRRSRNLDGTAGMRPRGTAFPEGPAAAMGRTAVDRVHQSQRRRLRASFLTDEPQRLMQAFLTGNARGNKCGRPASTLSISSLPLPDFPGRGTHPSARARLRSTPSSSSAPARSA